MDTRGRGCDFDTSAVTQGACLWPGGVAVTRGCGCDQAGRGRDHGAWLRPRAMAVTKGRA